MEASRLEIIKLVKNNMTTMGQVLDIGCGLGDNAIVLAKNRFSVTCMDIVRLPSIRVRSRVVNRKLKSTFWV
jgi:2-polyprenyl-3-methyl-5-hydroxy-6-metoxy-1,4-benzoquinol methylase